MFLKPSSHQPETEEKALDHAPTKERPVPNLATLPREVTTMQREDPSIHSAPVIMDKPQGGASVNQQLPAAVECSPLTI